MKSILGIIANVLKLVVRFFDKRDEPEAVRRREQNEIDKAVVSLDGDSVNKQLADSLGRLQNKSDRPAKR